MARFPFKDYFQLKEKSLQDMARFPFKEYFQLNEKSLQDVARFPCKDYFQLKEKHLHNMTNSTIKMPEVAAVCLTVCTGVEKRLRTLPSHLILGELKRNFS